MRITGGSAGGRLSARARPTAAIMAVPMLIGGVIVGYAGQSVVKIGAPSHVSVSAAVTGSFGGIGSSQPVRVRLQVGVVNTGDAPVRVVGSWSDTRTTAVRSLTPSVIEVPAGGTGYVAVDVSVACTWPTELTLPSLRLEEPDGQEQPLPLTGAAAALTDACSRGIPGARPVEVVSAKSTNLVAGPPQKQPGKDVPSGTADDATHPAEQLRLVLNSPSGRTTQIVGITAGGVGLAQAGQQATVLTGGRPATLTLTAPATCPEQWRAAGLPTTVRADLGDGSAPLLQIGSVLSTWLLATACSSDQP